MEIWPFVCSRECSCCFLRFRALRAARYSNFSTGQAPLPPLDCDIFLPERPVNHSPTKACLPVLFVVTFSLAISSCFAIWFSKCLSRFCSMSSCCRRSSIAFLGASFLFCPPLPPNQAPHISIAVAVYSISGVQEVVTPSLTISGGSRSWRRAGVVEKVLRFDDWAYPVTCR